MIPRRFIKYVLERTWRPLVVRWLASDRTYRRDGIAITVRRGVFHPGLFFSTGLLLEFMERREVGGRRLLELGAGSGLIALLMARRDADVTASDINRDAVEAIGANAGRNGVRVRAVHSDLFDQLQHERFDVIIINPPYYPRDPATASEHAWFCGAGFEYFHRLFAQLPDHITDESEIYMILSEDCAIETITAIAHENRMSMREVQRKRKWWEMNFIYAVAMIE